MQTMNIQNIKINGVAFEDVTGRLEQPMYETVGTGVFQGKTYIKEEPTLKLDVCQHSDSALIMYGFLQAIKSLKHVPGGVVAVPLTIEGVDANAHWITYKGKFIVMHWSTTGSTTSRVGIVGLMGVGGFERIVDGDKKPKVQALLTEDETALIIAALIKAKQGTASDFNVETANRAIKHLRSATDDVQRGATSEDDDGR